MCHGKAICWAKNGVRDMSDGASRLLFVWVLVNIDGWIGPIPSIVTHQNPVLSGLGAGYVLHREAYQDALHVAYCKPLNEHRTPVLASVRCTSASAGLDSRSQSPQTARVRSATVLDVPVGTGPL
jgi:hypothetical protein